jgi:hypothetical protein
LSKIINSFIKVTQEQIIELSQEKANNEDKLSQLEVISIQHVGY